VTLLPEPLATTNIEAEKPPGKWTDEQKLTLETFKEVVATDVENVWVVAYIDPRCRDCLILSLEWEKLTQIEEKEKRKIKLGYVDISVEENWKIVQDHTKGKKITYTPQVALYGENKQSPHFYKSEKPDAEGVHTWVSSYADYFGYGYWNPDEYHGAGVMPKGYYAPQAGKDGYMLSKYGIGARLHHDGLRHEGDLAKVGVATGANGKGYSTEGKWRKGDQVVQVQQDDKGTVMRRRTITTGGKLTGAAHAPSEKYGYGGPRSYGGKQAYGAVNDLKTVKPYSGSGYGKTSSYGGYGQSYGGYGKQSYGGYGKQSYGGYGNQSYGGYGKQSHGGYGK